MPSHFAIEEARFALWDECSAVKVVSGRFQTFKIPSMKMEEEHFRVIRINFLEPFTAKEVRWLIDYLGSPIFNAEQVLKPPLSRVNEICMLYRIDDDEDNRDSDPTPTPVPYDEIDLVSDLGAS